MTSHPNRSQRTDAPAANPSPDDLRALRERHGLTQRGLADLIHGTERAVQDYEQGRRRMHPGLYALALLRLSDPNPLPP